MITVIVIITYTFLFVKSFLQKTKNIFCGLPFNFAYQLSFKPKKYATHPRPGFYIKKVNLLS